MTDYIKFLMAAADEDTLRRVVSDSAISKLKPVLKANGVKGISKMKKADIVEAVISLVRARKKPQMSKSDAALNMICEASSISEVRQIIDKNFTVKELRNLGWACFKEKNLPKSYIVEKQVIKRFLDIAMNDNIIFPIPFRVGNYNVFNANCQLAHCVTCRVGHLAN